METGKIVTNNFCKPACYKAAGSIRNKYSKQKRMVIVYEIDVLLFLLQIYIVGNRIEQEIQILHYKNDGNPNDESESDGRGFPECLF